MKRITISTAAKLLKISPEAVYMALSRGRLPRRVGADRHCYLLLSDVKKYKLGKLTSGRKAAR